MDNEIIYLTGMMFIDNTTFLPLASTINDNIFLIIVMDANTISLFYWDTSGSPHEYITNFTYTPDLATSTYIGGGQVTLFPKLNIISKDINLFQSKGLQTKLSRLDFLIEPQPNAQVTINLILNSTAINANILANPKNLSINTKINLGQEAPEYLWFNYFQTLSAQYFKIQITYDDDLMNNLITHQSNMTLYAINAWSRPGGRLTNL